MARMVPVLFQLVSAVASLLCLRKRYQSPCDCPSKRVSQLAVETAQCSVPAFSSSGSGPLGQLLALTNYSADSDCMRKVQMLDGITGPH